MHAGHVYHDLLEVLYSQTVEQRFIELLETLEVDELVDGLRNAAQMLERALQLHLDGLHHRREESAQTQAVPLFLRKGRTCALRKRHKT